MTDLVRLAREMGTEILDGDSIGGRWVGDELGIWHKPKGGVWVLVGTQPIPHYLKEDHREVSNES